MSSLSRILHVAHGIPSYHNGLIELADRLRRTGIELVVASHNDLTAVLQPHGHEFIQLTADSELDHKRKEAMAPCNAQLLPGRFISQYRVSRRYRQQSLQTTEIHQLVERLQPDLLLMDMECHKAIIQAHTIALPMVLLSRWYSVFRHGNNPPMHTLMQPATTLPEALRIRWSWTKLRLFKSRLSIMQGFSRRRFRCVTYDSNARPDLTALAKSSGLSIREISDTSHWLIPHIYTHLPVMSLTIKALEFTSAQDPRMHYVGAMVGAQDTSHPRYQDGIRRLQHFNDKRASRQNPLIYCSLSTFWITQQDIIKRVIDLFIQRPDWDLVIGLGGRQSVDNWTQLPDNILLLDYAPQLEILKQADVAITHGGVSTINEAMINGTPVIVCSSGHVDQNGCTARVAYHEVGRCCQPGPLDIKELEGHIHSILEDDSHQIHNNVNAIRDAQNHYDNSDSAVSFLREAVSTQT